MDLTLAVLRTAVGLSRERTWEKEEHKRKKARRKYIFGRYKNLPVFVTV